MSTKLCIQVSAPMQQKKQELEFMYSEEWNADTEAVLLQRIREILSHIRQDGITLRITLDLDVKDPEQVYFQLKKQMHQTHHPSIRNHTLSLREVEILGYIMQGLTNQQIAEKLFLSYETIKSHRKHILSKTGAPNTAALINYYHQTFFEK